MSNLEAARLAGRNAGRDWIKNHPHQRDLFLLDDRLVHTIVEAAADALSEAWKPAQTWEYFAGLAFAYYDAQPEGTDDVHHAWHELASAIRHYRAVGGTEPSVTP